MKTYSDVIELYSLGLPEIPAPYSLRFKIKRIVTGQNDRKYSNVLYVTVYKTFLGFPFPWKSAYMSREERANRYSSDISFLLNNGYLTEEEFDKQEWFPAHLAVAGKYAYDQYIYPEIFRKKRKELDKLKNTPPPLVSENLDNIKDFLHKGMP